MPIRPLLLVAGTAILSSFATYQFASGNAPVDAARSDCRSCVASTSREPEGQCEETALTVVVAPEKHGLSSAIGKRAADDEKNAITSQPETGQRVKAEEKARRESTATFTEFMATRRHKGSNQKEIIATLEQRFHNEKLNYQWASRREDSILDLFESESQLNAISPLNVTCKSVNCQVVLPVTDQSQINALSSSFSSIVAAHDIGMENPSVSFIADESSGRLVFYLSNSNNTELFR